MTNSPGRAAIPHRLTPLLKPASIAYIGASTRADTPGNRIVSVPCAGGYAGRMYPINPNYEMVEGLPCYASLRDLPEAPDMVVIAVADHRLEAALQDVVAAGAKSAVIFGGANLVEDIRNPLPARLKALAKEANLPVCGGNCMGFYNLDHSLLATFANTPYATRTGGITLLSHSGSSWSALTLNDGRLGFNLSVSAGQELTVGIADYLDYAVEQPSTKVVGLILETVREPETFIAALEKANQHQVPVVALKVGQSEKSASLAISHSGAIAGDDAAYEAVFDRYGVSRAYNLEQLGASLLFLSQPCNAAPGAVAAIHDSGFERELLVDRAELLGVPLADISAESIQRLTDTLDPGLEPVNPVDAWGTGREYRQVFIDCFDILLSDADTSLGLVSHNVRDQSWISDAWVATCLEGARKHDKPIALVSSFPWTRHSEVTQTLTDAGVAMIEGMDNGLIAARALMHQRDFICRPPIVVPEGVASDVREFWAARLANDETLGEMEVMTLLQDYGVETLASSLVITEVQALDAAREIAGAVVMKTAMPDIHHKTEVNGVHLNVNTDADVVTAYADLCARLGPKVSIAPMVGTGVEMSLGIVNDAQFGPLVMLGAGGVLIELLGDRRLALPPFDVDYALRLVGELRVARLLRGFRGSSAGDIMSFARSASRLSVLARDLGAYLSALDINPVIVNADGAIGVDALVVPKNGARA
jgi:acyl-CoA synthetase (NDP forming)